MIFSLVNSKSKAAWAAAAAAVIAALGVAWFVTRESTPPRPQEPAGATAAGATPVVPLPESAHRASHLPAAQQPTRDYANERREPVPFVRPDTLTAEEGAILDQYGREGLPQAAAEAQNAYVTARPGDEAEADRRYLLILNLVGKLDPPGDDVPGVTVRQAAYLAALPAEQARLANVPEAERNRRLYEFKAAFLEEKQTGASK